MLSVGDGFDLSSALTGAGIVPPTSIRGIRLGITKAQVREILGKPEKIERYAGGPVARYVYGLTTISFFRDSQRVQIVSTRSPGVRTKDGIGTGSLLNAVDASAGTKCEKWLDEIPDDGFTVREWHQECVVDGNGVRMTFYFPVSYDGPQNASSKVSQVILWPDSDAK